MRSILLVLLIQLLAACAWVKGEPDTRLQDNYKNILRLGKADPNPADVAANVAAAELAAQIAVDYDRGSLEAAIAEFGKAAGGTGTPWGLLIASVTPGVLAAVHSLTSKKDGDAAHDENAEAIAAHQAEIDDLKARLPKTA
jgi:hypothetical protein